MVRLCFGRQPHDGLSLGDARRFSYGSLQLATDNFSHHRIIGEGGSAEIYRGVLPNGTVIAVKRYSAGRVKAEEFFRMVEIISGIRHPNIHQVIGYCIHKSHVSLVSEYVDNGSLYDLLDICTKKKENRLAIDQQHKIFSWPMRVAVCIGIARGLTHLHEEVNPRAVHRDIRPSNILLDANFTPKITDFDLVSYFPTSDDKEFNVCAGTLGYMDPEYYCFGRLTQKSDVYGFGVTMLQIISGRNSYRDRSLFIGDWALDLLQDDRVLDLVDPVLTDFPADDVRHCIHVALLCIKREPKQRPSMREVTQTLEGAWNIFGRQLIASYSPHYFSAASSFRSSISQSDDEGGGETQPAASEIEEAETSAPQSRRPRRKALPNYGVYKVCPT